MYIEDLLIWYHNCTKLTHEDISLGADLWQAYQNNNAEQLQKLSENASVSLPYVQEVCIAPLERVQNQRPEKIIQQIINSGVNDFTQLFRLFSLTEGVYGFGKLQVK